MSGGRTGGGTSGGRTGGGTSGGRTGGGPGGRMDSGPGGRTGGGTTPLVFLCKERTSQYVAKNQSFGSTIIIM